MSQEWQAFLLDPRTVCKYGEKCYQKNPDHHQTFKHPPKDLKRKIGHNRHKRRVSPYTKGSETSKVTECTNSSDKNVQSAEEGIVSRITETTSEKIQIKPIENSQSSQTNMKLPDKISFYSKDGLCSEKLFRELFLVAMPQDFFKFFECLSKEDNFEKTLSKVNLQLIGPFDLLTGKLPILEDKELYLVHWRFFYDPPEFQAVLKKTGKSEYHIGYFRDSPDDKPAFLAFNDSAKDCHLSPIADNIFAAVYFYLDNEKGKSPFSSLACQRLMEKVKKWAEELKYPIEKFDAKKRLSKCVTKTFHGAGIMVPFNKKTEIGYRQLAETDANLKKLFQKFSAAQTQKEKDQLLSEIQPVITYANIAVDECDFGTGLEIGIDLFCSGLKEMEPSALSCLTSAYSLLERPAFEKIIQVHMKYRRRGPNMSILSET